MPDVLCPGELFDFSLQEEKSGTFIDSLFNVGQISRCQFFLIHIFCHALGNRLLSN